jgi:CxxC-x17-CxxC domain-containing protein
MKDFSFMLNIRGEKNMSEFRQRRDSGSRGQGRDFGPKEMHKATCSECGEECEVPFKPTEGKPVYCRECFRKRRSY